MDKSVGYFNSTGQRFSTSVPWDSGVLQGFLKHATPDHVVRVTDQFRLSNKKTTIVDTTIANWCELIILIFFRLAKNIVFGVPVVYV